MLLDVSTIDAFQPCYSHPRFNNVLKGKLLALNPDFDVQLVLEERNQVMGRKRDRDNAPLSSNKSSSS